MNMLPVSVETPPPEGYILIDTSALTLYRTFTGAMGDETPALQFA
jgi:hypothetical protein